MALSSATAPFPQELLDEFVHQSEDNQLRKLSLVSHRWRKLSQQRLFEAVVLDPMHDNPLYELDNPAHKHLANHIKKLFLVKRSVGNAAVPFPSLHPKLAMFLRGLSCLQEIFIAHWAFSWSHIPEDARNAFLDALERPSFHTLGVIMANDFPALLFLRGPNIKSFILTVVWKPGHQTMTPGLTLGPSETRLTTLRLGGIRCIEEFAKLVMPDSPAFESMRCISMVTLSYIEGLNRNGLTHSTMVGILLRRLGNSIKSLGLSVTQFGPDPASIPCIPPKDLQNLTELRDLNIHLTLERSVAGNITAFATAYVIPIFQNLPSSRSLTRLKLSCQVYTEGSSTFEEISDPISVFLVDLDKTLIGAGFIKLKEISISVDLFAYGERIENSSRREGNIPVNLKMLSEWGVGVEAKFSDSAQGADGTEIEMLRF